MNESGSDETEGNHPSDTSDGSSGGQDRTADPGDQRGRTASVPLSSYTRQVCAQQRAEQSLVIESSFPVVPDRRAQQRTVMTELHGNRVPAELRQSARMLEIREWLMNDGVQR